jgi:hypothetical protein
MKATKKNGKLLWYLESDQEMIELAEHIRDNANADTEYNGLKCSSISGDYEFTHTNSLDEAIKLARYGWPEGTEEMIALAASIDTLQPTGTRVAITHDIDGDFPNVDLFLLGEPENMSTIHGALDNTPGKVLRVCHNVTVNCGVEADHIRNHGIALFSAIQTVMAMGYTVELTLGTSTPTDEIYWPILEAGSPVNIDTLAFWLTHPSVLRRMVFAAQENASPEDRRRMGAYYHGGYGQCTDLTAPPGEPKLLLKEHGQKIREKEKIKPRTIDYLKKMGLDPEEEL